VEHEVAGEDTYLPVWDLYLTLRKMRAAGLAAMMTQRPGLPGWRLPARVEPARCHVKAVIRYQRGARPL